MGCVTYQEPQSQRRRKGGRRKQGSRPQVQNTWRPTQPSIPEVGQESTSAGSGSSSPASSAPVSEHIPCAEQKIQQAEDVAQLEAEVKAQADDAAELEAGVKEHMQQSAATEPVQTTNELANPVASANELAGAEQLVQVPAEEVLNALSAVYSSLTAVAVEPRRKTRFHSIAVPNITIGSYLARLRTFFQCSDACFITGLVYIDRIVKMYPEFAVSNLSVHRLLATSTMLSAKFLDDIYYSNAYYAKVSGLSVREINVLEVAFLKMINWKVQVTPEEFNEYSRHVLRATATRASESA